jgi:hypothetical protein
MDRSSAKVSGVPLGAVEDLRESILRHRLVRNPTALGTFPQNKPLPSGFVVPQNDLIIAVRDLLAPELFEGFVPKKGTVGEGHGQKKPRVTVDK